MTRNWTAAQQAAIDMRNKTLLVSAAAGSGKTATLTERIIRRITDKESPADISKMLIVTFTRTAAAELKSRIFDALNTALAENPSDKNIASQLLKLGSAKISTIDSFYFDLVQSNASILGLPSRIKIADDAEYFILARDAMERAIDGMYEKCDDFASLVECFSGIKASNFIAEIFLDFHEKLSGLPEGIEFVRLCAEKAEEEKDLDFFATSYGKILFENSSEAFEHFLGALSSAVDFANSNSAVYDAYGTQFIYDLDTAKALCSAVKNGTDGYKSAREIILGYSPLKLKALKGENISESSLLFKELHGQFKDLMADYKKKAFSKSPETISRAMKETASRLTVLYRLFVQFESLINEDKARLGILTFTDIRRYTLSLVMSPDGSQSEFAKKYSQEFSEIYIDEYQDVDRVQDLIFSLLSKGDNRFMVGDIKQSIFSFRGSEPQLFADYRAKFPDIASCEAKHSEGASIFMSDNFRCDENIIKFTNRICSRLFTAAGGGMDYTEKDDLRFAKAKPHEDYISPKVQLSFVNVPSRTNRGDIVLSDKEIEAEYIAAEIQELLKNGKKANGEPIFPEDIAVLYRRKRISPLIAAALKRRGILSTDADAEKYFENPDVLMLLCILNAIDNPQRDIYLAGALRSPVFNFTIDELICIRSSYDSSYSLYAALEEYSEEKADSLSEKCRSFLKTLSSWQELSLSMPIDKFLQMLFDSDLFMATGLVSQVKDDGEGGNLLLLYEFARGFEQNGFKGLYQFIEYINSMIENGKTFDIGEQGKAKNRVSLMTMHKSKGLEFPVCFICEANASLRSQESRESLVFKHPFGIALKLSEESGFARINTPMREAVLSCIAEKQAEEEMRIFYVALTRAREKLYISCTTAKDEEALFSEAKLSISFFDRYTVLNECSSYLDWIMLSCKESSGEEFEFFFTTAEELLSGSAETPKAEEKEEITENFALTEYLKDSFAFSYPYAKLSAVPSKLSVSRLYPDILDQNDNSIELFEKKDSLLRLRAKGEKAKPSSAERGTATHLFLQFCDFENASRNGIDQELARLESRKFLPPRAQELIYKEELARFLESPLLKMLLTADKIIREQRFNVELPIEDFTSDGELLERTVGEKLAVQGVIDLIFIDAKGDITLVDYKTDRLSTAELNNDALAKKKMNSSHGLQLSYYAKAVELLLGKPCSRVCVYSTHSARLYDIDIFYDKDTLSQLHNS